ncbi:hypothetical protein AX14_006524 [Amanita brunnescens Koide BX004]|nr:hypothetical protein AX14_006524 [Amanita brunnescens Koide BX004]
MPIQLARLALMALPAVLVTAFTQLPLIFNSIALTVYTTPALLVQPGPVACWAIRYAALAPNNDLLRIKLAFFQSCSMDLLYGTRPAAPESSSMSSAWNVSIRLPWDG